MSEKLSSPILMGGEEIPAGGNTKKGAGLPVADHFGFGQVQPAWFDVRVFYVRVTNCPLDDTPDYLIMRYPPRDICTALEVNGGRISPSEELKLTLRRDRLDTESSEVTYVSTDNFRASGTVFFEVYDKEVVLLSGNFERSAPSPSTYDYLNDGDDDKKLAFFVATQEKPAKVVGWKMDLTCVVTSTACAFLKARQEFSAASLIAPPTIEVTVVGRYAGSPVTLSEIVQLTVRRKVKRKHTLHAIVEGDEGDNFSGNLLLNGQHDQQVPGEFDDYAELKLGTYAYGSDGTLNVYGENEDGELSWFNAGVRVGVGLGLGMCLGVGIGVGLLMRTYQATTRTFRRNMF
ncbi:unnamed protein product [Calypogeia fissa]